MQPPRFVDLFAGCGGLSLGLQKAGFDHVLAVEKSDMAAETYYHNFVKRLPANPAQARGAWRAYLDTSIEHQFERGLLVTEVATMLDRADVMGELRKADLDLVAGGPPCQGFSMAGRRNPSDARNQLPWQFLEVVEATAPKAVIVENVVGMGQDFVKYGSAAPFGQLRLALEATDPGYTVQPLRLNAMHYGVPQHRPRVFLVGLRDDVAAGLGIRKGLGLWRSEERLTTPCLAPPPVDGPPIPVDEALWDLSDEGYTQGCGSHQYATARGAYAHELRCEPHWNPPSLPETTPPGAPLNHTLRRHSEQTQRRFELYQCLRDLDIRSGIVAVAADPASGAKELFEFIGGQIREEAFPVSCGDLHIGDIGELVEVIRMNATRKHSQRAMKADLPAPTVLSLPDDFVHPIRPRTLTVREMARIQSFPDAFEFRSKETTGSLRRRVEVPQYTQVGNAVPPKLALHLGRLIAERLSEASRLPLSAVPVAQ